MKSVNGSLISIAISTIFFLSFQSTDAADDFIISQNVSAHRRMRRSFDDCYGGADCESNPSGICQSDNDCDDHYKCKSGRCVDYCHPEPCGPNAWHVVWHHSCHCLCFDGYQGDPYIGCTKHCQSNNECDEFEKCENNQCTDVCTAGSCGKGFVRCIPRNHQAQCECAYGYTRNAFGKCVVNCTHNDDCFDHQKCEDGECIPRSTCGGKPCGIHTNCNIEAGQSICSCDTGYTGDPSIGCALIECMTHYHCPMSMKCETSECVSACDEDSCGPHTRCAPEKGHYDVCHCLPGYIGDARTGCVDQCNTDRDCPSFERCSNNKCINECIENPPESRHARCDIDGQTTRYYYCNEGYTNAWKKRGIPDCHYSEVDLPMALRDQYSCSPQVECLRNCTNDSNCYNHERCVDDMCTSDVCKNFACGQNAVCESGPNGATCFCKKGFLGDPSTKCEKGCNDHEDCNHYEVCNSGQCVSWRKSIEGNKVYV